MIKPPLSKLIVYLTLIFVAGGISGAALISEFPRHNRNRGFPTADRMLHRLQRELALTPEQSAKIQPILDKMVADYKEINTESVHKTCAVMHSRNQEIIAVLKPEQAEKLQAMEHERIEKLQRSTH
jgi:Spy/CpxP family protein refolding chaperone